MTLSPGTRLGPYEVLAPLDAPGGAIGLAIFYLTTGDIDEALSWVEKSLDRRERFVLLPVLLGRTCSSSPRWPAILKKLNLAV